jgi:hypothetical protein
VTSEAPADTGVDAGLAAGWEAFDADRAKKRAAFVPSPAEDPVLLPAPRGAGRAILATIVILALLGLAVIGWRTVLS